MSSQIQPQITTIIPTFRRPKLLRRAMLSVLEQDYPAFRLCEPLDYAQFVAALKRCHLVLTDSGGVQEEAPALGKPVLVMRTDTERPEAIEAGVARLVGTDRNAIVGEVSKLLTDDVHYAAMAQGGSPYGDGRAAERIVTAIERFLAP